MKTMTENKEELLRCPVCDVYLKREEGFICPKCKRGPLCRKHRAPGKRECTSCVFEMISNEITELRRQEEGLKSFLRLLQFLFIVFAILFISMRAGVREMVEFLNYSIISNSILSLGIISVLGYVLFYVFLLSQQSKIKELQSRMNKTEFRRAVR